MKIIVAGSRDFNDYKLLSNTLHEYTSYDPDCEIISGKARGADSLGEKWAKSMGVSVKEFPADSSKYGKSAGYIRNKQMAKYGDVLIAFWDGKSKGTKHMIGLANEHKLIVKVIKY